MAIIQSKWRLYLNTFVNPNPCGILILCGGSLSAVLEINF